MAVKKHGVHFDITAENAADRALQAVEQNLNRVNRAADAVGRTLQSAFIATAAISAGRMVADAAIQAERAQARLGAVLRATGGVAEMSQGQIESYAEALSKSTEFDGESLRNGASQLVKFGTIHGEVFKGAMAVSADLAAFMGTDFTTAVQAVGKALHSPSEGLGALEKQIGRIDPTLRRWLQTLVENGQVAEAQNVVLQTLRGRIGGVAEEMNSGLFKAARGVKEAWGDVLKAFGQTEAFQSGAKSSLGFLEQSLRDIKEIVENGDWVEKTLAVLAYAGGWRGFKLTPQGGGGSQVATGKIGGVRPQMTPEQEAAGAMMNEDAVALWRKNKDRMAAEAERAREKWMREAERGAEHQVRLEEMAADDSREAWDAYTKGRLEQEEQVRKAREEGLKAWFETIDMEQEEAIRQGEEFLEAERERKRALEESEQAARDLGFTFASAFEDAVLEGKKLSDVLRGLAKDVARIFLRKTVTEPLANAAADIFKGFDLGSILRADGGPVMAGQPYIVGERGPELMVPNSSGTVVPNHALGGGGVVIKYADLRGASVEAVARLERFVMQLDGSIENRAVGAYAQARTRGRL